MIISIDRFGGEAPSIAAENLPPHMAQVAINCDLRHGDLRPLRGMTTLSALGDPTARSIFWHNNKWFSWPEYVGLAASPLPNNNGRTYVLNETANGPREFDYTTEGAGPVPSGYLLAKTPPVGAPTMTLGAGGGCEVALQVSITAYYTYLTGWSEESAPSPACAVADVCEGQTITLDGFSAPTAGENVTHIKLYVALNGTYLYLATIPIATTSYQWAFSSETLGLNEASVSEEWVPLPDGAQGLLVLPNGIGVAFLGNELFISEPWQLHAWPLKYRKSTDAPITALVPVGNIVSVLTEGNPNVLFGSHPESMELRRIESPHACTGTLSAVDLGDVGIYSGPEGLVEITPTGVTRVVTGQWYTPDDWKTLVNPETVRGYRWGDSYLGFYARANEVTFATCESACTDPLCSYSVVYGGFIYNKDTDGLRYLSEYAVGGRWTADRNLTGEIVGGFVALLVNGDIVRFSDEAAPYLTATWRSKPFESAYAVNLGAAQVIAKAYPVTFRLIGDGLVRHARQVYNNKPFRLPSKYRALRYAIEIETEHPVTKVLAAETMAELGKIA